MLIIMKKETCEEKIRDLQKKIKETNPRFKNKIAEMKEDLQRMKRLLKEKESSAKPEINNNKESVSKKWTEKTSRKSFFLKKANENDSTSKEKNDLSSWEMDLIKTKKLHDLQRRIRENEELREFKGEYYRKWRVEKKGYWWYVHDYNHRCVILPSPLWLEVKDQIDEIETRRESLLAQVGNYRGWSIRCSDDYRLCAKKPGHKEVYVDFRGDIKSVIDEIEKNEKNKEQYRGWTIVKQYGESLYEAKKGKSTNCYAIYDANLASLKKEIDEFEKKLKKIDAVLKKADAFCKKYKGWTIRIRAGRFFATKKGERNIEQYYSRIKFYGVDECIKEICDSIDSYEKSKNEKHTSSESSCSDAHDAYESPEGLYDYWKG